jgi:hypothetical protein
MPAVLVLYPQAPDPERYARHAELCRAVPGAEFAHGPVTATVGGEPAYAYAAQFWFPDSEAFRTGTRSAEFAATGADAAEMGVPASVHFVDRA